jgi:hypothetical protein
MVEARKIVASDLEPFGYNRDTTATFLLGFATAVVILWQYTRLTVLWDVSYILENATRIAAGDLPYRDFPFPYAPLTFFVQALLIRLFGRVYWHHVAYAVLAGALATALAYRLTRRFVAFPTAVALTSPLCVLGIYCVFLHPFYDPDTCLLLLAIFSLHESLCFLPLIAKQNIGLPFAAMTIVRLALQRRWRAVLAALGGVAALAILIAATAGLGNYIRWTVRFAAERRLPSLASQLAIYNDPTLWWWVAVAAVALLAAPHPAFGHLLPASGEKGNRFPLAPRSGERVVRSGAKDRVRGALRWLIVVPWLWSEWRLFASDDPLERQIDLLRFWPLLVILALIAAVRARDAFPLLVIAAIHGAFLSQSTWGSTYGIWPLLVLLMAFVWRDLGCGVTRLRGCDDVAPQPRNLATSQPVVTSVIVALVMLHHGWLYVAGNDRLTYAKVSEGELHHSTLPSLRGMAMRGEWLPDFEELVAWSERNIPRGDAILSMPGEDLFYFTTGRRPRFPVLMFDRTINPYAPAQIAALAKDVRWVIVKKRLQLNGEPMPELAQTLALLRPRFEVAAELHNYQILKRREWTAAKELPERTEILGGVERFSRRSARWTAAMSAYSVTAR